MTDREKQVKDMKNSGLSFKEIAARLGLKTGTVKAYFYGAQKKDEDDTIPVVSDEKEVVDPIADTPLPPFFLPPEPDGVPDGFEQVSTPAATSTASTVKQAEIVVPENPPVSNKSKTLFSIIDDPDLLNELLSCLNGIQRAVFCRHKGLFGAAEDFEQLAIRLKMKYSTVEGLYERACSKLENHRKNPRLKAVLDYVLPANR